MSTTPLYPATKYTYRVLWSDDDHQYVGRCSEFPLLNHLALTHDEALEGIIGCVRDVLDDMHRSKQDPPIPLAIRLGGGRP